MWFIAFAIHGSGDVDEVASPNNRFDLTMAFVTVRAVASLLGTNRANSPLQVKRMLGGRCARRIYFIDARASGRRALEHVYDGYLHCLDE